jgi:metal-dependent HD superfamily phosphatase/phosphodiesterase
MRSGKELSLDAKILDKIRSLSLTGKAEKTAELFLKDEELQSMQEYANMVSIVRLKYNDHGPVHTRTVALNAIVMMDLLRRADIRTSLETEECGDFEDSLCAVLAGAFLHDVGMSIGRQDHELHSTYLACPILDRILAEVYPLPGTTARPERSGGEGSPPGRQSERPAVFFKRVMIRSLALEAISGHMGNRSINSLEAGIVQIADGCDMKKGRARIPLAMAGSPRMGDIHQYSANSIEELTIERGKEKPISIRVIMSSEVGLFQVEEVLLNKIAAGTAKSYIELYAILKDGRPKRYL